LVLYGVKEFLCDLGTLIIRIHQ